MRVDTIKIYTSNGGQVTCQLDGEGVIAGIEGIGLSLQESLQDLIEQIDETLEEIE